MKKIAIVCLFAITAALAFADAELDMYTFLYDGSQTQLEQLAILQNMAEANISGAGDFYAKALSRLVGGYSNIRTATVTERSAASEQAKLLAGFFGDRKKHRIGPGPLADIYRFSAKRSAGKSRSPDGARQDTGQRIFPQGERGA